MNKRFIVFLLIMAGVIILAIVAFFVLKPLFQQTPTQPNAPVQGTQTKPSNGTKQTPAPNAPAAQVPSPGTPEERERLAEEALKQQSSDFAARALSVSNADGFAGMEVVYTASTNDLQAYFANLQKQLTAQHPITTSWRQTVRPVASRIVSALPILDKTTAQATVQAQVIVNEEGKPQAVTYQEITISYVKQGSTWVASKIETAPFQP